MSKATFKNLEALREAMRSVNVSAVIIPGTDYQQAVEYARELFTNPEQLVKIFKLADPNNKLEILSEMTASVFLMFRSEAVAKTVVWSTESCSSKDFASSNTIQACSTPAAVNCFSFT